MKYFYRTVGITLAIFILLLVIARVALERGEVVELHTLDPQNERVVTELWVVDDAGLQYLRAGNPEDLWLARIRDNYSVELTRNGETRQYTAVVRVDKRDRINRLMAEKYTWGDSFRELLSGTRAHAVPVELHALD
ncbi:MAG: hypothetical protein H7A06_09615 [Pseudomonadales bacterium]|nr:hypothetical protein [Pseudomonadales bacterium]